MTSSRRERGQGSLEMVGVVVLAALLVAATTYAVATQDNRVGNTIRTAICNIVTLGQGNCGSADEQARTPEDYEPEPCVVTGAGESSEGRVAVTFVEVTGSEGWLIEQLSDGSYRLTRVEDAGVGGTAGIGFGATVTADGNRFGVEAQAGVSSTINFQDGETFTASSEEEARQILADQGSDDNKDFWLGDDNLIRSGWDGLFGSGEYEDREPDEWFESAGQQTSGSASATLVHGDAGVEGSVEAYLGTRHRSDGSTTEYYEVNAEAEGSAGVVVAEAGFEIGANALIEVDKDENGEPVAMRVVASQVGDAYAYDDPSEAENPEIQEMTVEIPLDDQEGRDLAARYMYATGLPVQGIFPDVGSDAMAIPFVDAMDATQAYVDYAADDGRMWSSTYTQDESTNGVNITGKLGGELGGSGEWTDTEITTTGAQYYDGTGWVDRPECVA